MNDQSREAPPAAWDEYALAEAQRLWSLPAMPKPQMVACLQVALVEAMQWSASQQAVPEGWRIERVSDGDVRVYGPDKETWLLRANPGKGTFEDFAHRLCFALPAAPTAQGGSAP